MGDDNKSTSSKNAGIRKRWKNAVKSIAAIGFKKSEGFLVKNNDKKDNDSMTTSDEMEESFSSRNIRKHSFQIMEQGFGNGETILECDVCHDAIETKEQENGQTKKPIPQCQACGLVAHIDCRPYASKNCQEGSALRNLNCKDAHSSKSQSNLTDSREVVNLSAENLFIGKKTYGKMQQETGKSAESLNSNNSNSNSNYHQQIVDPIYLALKEGNKMASMRKQSLVGPEQNAVVVGVNGRTMESPIAGSSTSRVSPTESTTSLPKHEKPSKMKLVSSTAKINNNSNEATSCKEPSFINKSSGSVNNSRIGSPQLGSSPDLLSDKATEISLESKPTSKTVVGGNKLIKRAPKLDVKLKSFSLDYSEASIAKKGFFSKNVVAVPNRHAYRVPPCKYNSFESDDTVQSSNSASPCPSSICGSTLMLPSNSYAVTHDYYAKFQDEIDLRVGERVLVVDTSDQDWWQGHNVSGRLGIFPSTCVAHIHNNERIMQIVQNVCLWVGSKNFRLYRDQIVFAQVDEIIGEGLITVRTERDHRVNCPLKHLMSLE